MSKVQPPFTTTVITVPAAGSLTVCIRLFFELCPFYIGAYGIDTGIGIRVNDSEHSNLPCAATANTSEQ